jgi:hypothetical protein
VTLFDDDEVVPLHPPRGFIISIDPGPTESAILAYSGHHVAEWGKEPNDVILGTLRRYRDPELLLAIEMVASFGMAVGRDVFQTCVWIGRFIERWDGEYRLVYRREVKQHLCRSDKAKDSNIRQALIDRFGGSKEAAIGKKTSRGPLYGLAGDGWSALAVAVTADETPSGVSTTGPSTLVTR